MGYHQSIAAPYEETVEVLSAVLSAHGYRLECSFDLRSARHGARASHDQFLVLLVYEESALSWPTVITAHECAGITRLQIRELPRSAAFTAALEEVSRRLPGTG